MNKAHEEFGRPKAVRAWAAVIDNHGSYQGDSRGLPVLYPTPKEAEQTGGKAVLVTIVPDEKGVRYWCVRCPKTFLTEDAAIEHFRQDGHGFSNSVHHGFLKREES